MVSCIFQYTEQYMGQQIQFFMDTADEGEFLSDAIASVGGTLCRPVVRCGADLSISRLEPIVTKPPIDFVYYIRPLPSDDDLSMRHSTSEFMVVDVSKSLVIEFERSRILDGICYPGRLWYESRKSDGTLKSSEFLMQADAVISWIRDSYRMRKQRQSVSYLGPSVAAALDLGSVRIA